MATLSSLIPAQTQTQTPLLSLHHNHPKSLFLSFPPPTKSFLRLRLSSSPTAAATLSLKTTPTTLSLSEEPQTTPKINPLSSGPTRTLTTLFALAVAAARRLSLVSASAVSAAAPLAPAAAPLFFAAVRDLPRGRLNTPLTVVAAGVSKWLDIYCGVLLVRVLLSWFPNIPWDRQPLSAIRDLCDPFLNLFRNIIPPVFDTLDVSPLLAFGVLGFVANVLSGIRRVM